MSRDCFLSRKGIHLPIKSGVPQGVLRRTLRKVIAKSVTQRMFVSKMADADGEATETQVWLDFAENCGYMSKQRRSELLMGYEEVGRMLGGMIAHPERFSG